MMKRTNKAWLKSALVGGLLVCALHAVGKPRNTFHNSPYAYNADDVYIGKVLKDLTSSFGVNLQIDTKLTGNLNSRIRTNSAAAFLDRLALEYGFIWFVYTNTLYITENSDHQVYRMEVSDASIYDLRSALESIGLLDPRFGWGELPGEGVVLVSGPKRYIELVKKFSRPSRKSIAKKRRENMKFEVMVFPLRFASVTDREVSYRSEGIVIPGVASLVRQLLAVEDNTPVGELNNLYNINRDRIIGHTQRLEGTEALGLPASVTQELEGISPIQASNVSADVRGNSVLIYDDVSKRSMYKRLIQKLDKPSRMVEIDAIILDIERTQLSEIGVNWAYKNNGTTFGALNPAGLVQTATLFIRNPDKFYADLRLLESQGKATVLANPSVLTLANQPAVIDSSETSFIQTSGERVVDIKEVTAGTSLQVVPRILSSGSNTTIQLDVDIEDGKIFEDEDKSTPSVNRSTISTQALVSPEQSLVFGGFHVSENTRNTSKVPILGDIPVLGNLFSTKNVSTKKRVRLFILTPRILDSAVTQDPRNYVSREDRSIVNKSLEDIKRRRHGAKEMLKVDIGNALTSLIGGYIPDGFERGKVTIPQCRKDVIIAKFSDEDQYVSKDLSIIAGTIYNPSANIQRYDEKNCASQGVLAVSAWPSTQLGAGEKAELYVVVKSNKTKSKPRSKTKPQANKTDKKSKIMKTAKATQTKGEKKP
ncbi:type III secretion system outer membrane ring subunit SctC [Vibrio lentus]|uniref:type III secretion system outer membrane ring subunit SctC n=1 Tax=Vibrio lentus TaxID=136468 RepID=UPI000C82E0F6|nr:type III secretion system outer membrane ring subunit SctC [Vibrio lentus]MCC4839889.1 type III secretion system outer membrane ring subunit SctC [Vibrio lentus]PML34267.1 EscC/YscC/HrcC family type III secretion system outer membrane ring protein [Vibrio lentus]